MAKVFISYSRKDLNFVEELASDLINAGLDVWYDLSRLDGGSRWSQEIEKAIREADHVIMVVSPDSVQSKWVEEEFLLAGELKKNILPLHHRKSEIPFGYRTLHFIDVQGKKYQENFHLVIRALGAKGSPGVVKPKRNYSFLVAILVVVVLVGAILFGTLSNREEPSPTQIAEANFTPKPTSTTPPTESITETPVVETLPEGFSDTDPTGNTIPMQFVAAGEFEMGSNTSSYTEERPAHTVYLDDYYIDTFEVTNARYKACVDAGVCQPPKETSSATRSNYYGNPEYDEHPVIYVDWEMAVTYCEWRGGQLPSEAQWEKAARGTDGRPYPWGEGIDAIHANYGYNIGDTTPVGNYEAGKSPYGLFDMTGNVWEWVADWYSGSYYQASPTSNPTGPESGQFRGLRGGSWINEAEFVRTFTRGWNQLEYFEFVDFGFRCATDVAP